MPRIYVDSTNVESVEYDEARERLTVHYHSGATYDYDRVSQDKVAALLGADSIGKHMNRHIIPHHTHTMRNPAPGKRKP